MYKYFKLRFHKVEVFVEQCLPTDDTDNVSCKFRLQVACKCDGFMCYGPLVADGYATCYNPRDNDVNIATAAFVAHRDTSCGEYRAALERALQHMHDLLLANVPSKL